MLTCTGASIVTFLLACWTKVWHAACEVTSALAAQTHPRASHYISRRCNGRISCTAVKFHGTSLSLGDFTALPATRTDIVLA